MFDTDDVSLITVSAGAGDGSDKITGGGNRDTLLGEGGRDFIDGGTHSDPIVGGGGQRPDPRRQRQRCLARYLTRTPA